MKDFRDIRPLDEQAMEAARARVDSLSKPLGSLGLLEEYAVQLAGIRGYVGSTLDNKAVLVFAADNGIHAQDITPVPKVVTQVQTLNIANGIAGVSVLARMQNAGVHVYNVGVELPIDHPQVKDVLVMPGTHNMAEGPAMSRQQCEQALRTGYAAVEEHKGCGLFGLGEMGICNTSSTAAVASVLLDESPDIMCGRGAGITGEHFERKVASIKQAIEVNQPDKEDPIDVIAKVGGLDIAAMTGAYLACAHYAKPVVIDGFISACAALCAVRIAPASFGYMFASHQSYEQGYMKIAEALGVQPAFDLQMRLGEGSGTPLMFGVLDAALRIVEEMGTFEEGNIDADGYVDLREE